MKPTRKGELLTLGLFFVQFSLAFFPRVLVVFFSKRVSDKNIEFMFAVIKMFGPTQIHFTLSSSEGVKMRVEFHKLKYPNFARK